MKKIKVLIIIISILIISTIILLISMKNNQNNQNDIDLEEQNKLGEYYEERIEEVTEVLDKNSYFTVNANLQTYYSYLQEENEEIITEDNKKEIIYELLHDKYLTENNITKDNVLEKNIEITYNNAYYSQKMYVLQLADIIEAYYVKGRIIDYTLAEPVKDAYNIVLIDKSNLTFSIIPSEEYSLEDLKNELNKYRIENIKRTANNTFSYSNVTEDSLVRIYFSDYIRKALYDTEVAFDSIEETYKKERFVSLDEYKEYINKNKDTLNKLVLEQYKVTNKDGYTEYICMNSMGEYYIFNAKEVMQYTILPDTYSVNIPEFTEKYNNEEENKKVAYNIDKIISAINNGDYKYVYDKMDPTFRQTNFQTIEVFEEMTEFLFFARNTVQYDEYEKRGNTHIYNITLKDYYGEIKYEKRKQIFMQLKDNYEYVFSFNLEDM